MYPGPWYGPGRHVHEGLGWGGWLLWVLFMIALWALVIMAVVWLVRSFTHRGPMTPQRAAQAHGGTGTVSAEQILAERFAHGQIDENEYRSRLGVLRGERPAATEQPQQPQPQQPPQREEQPPPE
jgi:putative membrane protein